MSQLARPITVDTLAERIAQAREEQRAEDIAHAAEMERQRREAAERATALLRDFLTEQIGEELLTLLGVTYHFGPNEFFRDGYQAAFALFDVDVGGTELATFTLYQYDQRPLLIGPNDHGRTQLNNHAGRALLLAIGTWLEQFNS